MVNGCATLAWRGRALARSRSGATSASPPVWIARPYLGSRARSKFSLPRESPPFKIYGPSRTIQSGNGGSGTVLPASECVLSPRNWIMPPRMNVWQVNFPAPVS